MVVMFLLGFVHSSAYALLVPPWQAPDEPGHFEYACLLDPFGRPLSRHSLSIALQQEIMTSMDQNNFWALVGVPCPLHLSEQGGSVIVLPPHQPGPYRQFLPIVHHQNTAGFLDIPFLLKSGRQVGDEPRLYYLIPAIICRADMPIDFRLRLTRLYGALLFGISGSVVVWGLQAPGHLRSTTAVNGLLLSANEGDALTRTAIMISVGFVLLPMPSFIAGSVNNDSMAILTATTVFAISTRISLDGSTRPRALGLAIMMVLALLSKKTTLFLLPYIGAYGLVETIPALRRLALARSTNLKLTNRRRRTCGFLVVLTIVMAVGVLPSGPTAKEWSSNVQSFVGVSRIKSPDSENASWAYLIVDNDATAFVRVFQWIEGPKVRSLAGQTLHGHVSVRSFLGESQSGCLGVRDPMTTSRHQFVADSTWRRVSVSHTVSYAADRIQMAIAPGSCDRPSDTGALLIDKASLVDAFGNSFLENGGFESGSSRGKWLLNSLRSINYVHNLLDDSQHSIDVLLFRINEMKPTVLRTAPTGGDHVLNRLVSGALLFPSFWGNFGWLQRPLPTALYGVLAVMCLLAVHGLIQSHHSLDAKTRRIIWYWILGTGLVLVQAIAPMIGHDWQPQGRYLFPSLLPIVGLLVIGLSYWTQGSQGSSHLWIGVLFLLMISGLSLHVASQTLP